MQTPDVDENAARVDGLIIRPCGTLRHREWSDLALRMHIPSRAGLVVDGGWTRVQGRSDWLSHFCPSGLAEPT